jgi:hypothetical protein
MFATSLHGGDENVRERERETVTLIVCVTVSPSPQPKNTTDRSIDVLWEYTRDFRHQYTIDMDDITYDLDDEDYNLAIRHLVVT